MYNVNFNKSLQNRPLALSDRHQQDHRAEQDFPLDSKLDDIPARQLAQPQGIFQEPAPKQGPSTNTCQTVYPNFVLAVKSRVIDQILLHD